ncbi:hypothetical protein IEO21_07714 [Rhodonia placenta]|uniref:Vacuolar calcium ion transporter n=1 Tax=Rhodonia placenta TaxID=104341 RepID=A0A8H7NXM0_9APHY|nr:hypothetical protein IEO21_07714 [Postia placenta]
MSSPPTDTTPLLENGNGYHEPRSFTHRVVDVLKAEGEPSWLASYRYFIFGSWVNVLLLFIPLSFIAEFLNWDAALRFSFSFLAIMPLAALLGTATDQMSMKLGQTLAGLLNASFGNAVEIIVGVAALLHDELRIVQTSMLGSILSNLLLVLGCSFFAGKYCRCACGTIKSITHVSGGLLYQNVTALVIPAAYHSSQAVHNPGDAVKGVVSDVTESEAGLRFISRGTALLLLVVYVGYLIFQVSKNYEFVCSTRCPDVVYFQLKTHASLFESEQEDEEPPKMNIAAAATGLLGATVVTSFCADNLVGSIEETADLYHIPKQFIGVILLPIVANAAEHVTSVWMARKNKMPLTISICVGSAIQLATFVVPLLVIVGWITHHDLTLNFSNFETIVLFVSVLLVQFLIQDGKSNYMEGMMWVVRLLL